MRTLRDFLINVGITTCISVSVTMALMMIVFYEPKVYNIYQESGTINNPFNGDQSKQNIALLSESGKRQDLMAENKNGQPDFSKSNKPMPEIIQNKQREHIVAINEPSKDASQKLEKPDWKKLQKFPDLPTGHYLIDTYGKADLDKLGANGSGIVLVGKDKEAVKEMSQKYNLNVQLSDRVPLNRMVPDARFPGCKALTYPEDLPSASIIIPFYDEWPSMLLRTIYSVINRTPRRYLHEIILVDDKSTLGTLQSDLDKYIKEHFPEGLVKVVRMPERMGLIQARLTGIKHSTGDVLVIFDSHMEVNIDWLQPLLTEIKKNRNTIAMANLDYINKDSFMYYYLENEMWRYVHNWRFLFWPLPFRQHQMGKTVEDPRPGTVMVGAAFAVDRKYFEEIGTYDAKMKVWGGENIELAWRVWLCGGRLIHLPCSHIGHVERGQPYSFPGGRGEIERFNYKRAVEVWMEKPYKDYVYDNYPEFKDLDVGDLSERLELKKRLKCKPFAWFHQNIWPELSAFSVNVTAWGSLRNNHTGQCLDNHLKIYDEISPIFMEGCHFHYETQGVSLTNEKYLRTAMSCLILEHKVQNTRPKLRSCVTGVNDKWLHVKGDYVKHEETGLCLDQDSDGLIMKTCDSSIASQHWSFNTYVNAQ